MFDNTLDDFDGTEFEGLGVMTELHEESDDAAEWLASAETAVQSENPGRYCGFNSIEELYEDTKNLFAEALAVPNRTLPPNLQDRRSDRTSLAFVLARATKQGNANKAKRERSEHQDERERRVELYAAQIAAGESIAYEPMVVGQATRDISDLI